ncbi:hypothetical protein ACXN5S_12610 [Pseudoroseicyclus sp. H15]
MARATNAMVYLALSSFVLSVIGTALLLCTLWQNAMVNKAALEANRLMRLGQRPYLSFGGVQLRYIVATPDPSGEDPEFEFSISIRVKNVGKLPAFGNPPSVTFEGETYLSSMEDGSQFGLPPNQEDTIVVTIPVASLPPPKLLLEAEYEWHGSEENEAGRTIAAYRLRPTTGTGGATDDEWIEATIQDGVFVNDAELPSLAFFAVYQDFT